MKLISIFLVISVLYFNCRYKSQNEYASGYDYTKPSLNLTLPFALHEISGLTIIDSATIACIQDEEGILFFYDLINHKIKKQQVFGPNGDYEGITRVGHSLYILRSDGVLLEIADYRADKLQVKTYTTSVPAINNEGLCYDSLNNRLLIGAKGKINKDPLYKDKRFIYEFNLSTKKLNQTAVFNFNIGTINAFAKNSGIKLQKKETKNGKTMEIGLKLNTSEIAIHPITKKLYVLSASDHCLFIFDSNGTLEHIEQLNPIIFNKAEGLSFFVNGDLLISNEGQKKQPSLLRFNYQL